MERSQGDARQHTAAEPADASATRNFLLERSGRSFAPVPKVFVQRPREIAGDQGRHGPLADFVRRRDKRGLLAFLLLHSIISSGDGQGGWSATHHLQVWARALNTVSTASGTSATSAATKVLTRLVERNLIARRRQGRERQVTVTLLSADGTGAPYVRPRGTAPESRFLRLNDAFWTEGWDEQLSLPAVAMLLVALHEKPDFSLPTEHVPDWYGWSADTAERGFRELRDHGLISVTKHIYSDPISPTGLSSRNIYCVRPPFDASSVDVRASARRIRRP